MHTHLCTLHIYTSHITHTHTHITHTHITHTHHTHTHTKDERRRIRLKAAESRLKKAARKVKLSKKTHIHSTDIGAAK